MVQEHNERAAGSWSRGGRGYDFVSFCIADALSHTAQALWPEPGERVLDIATGTGWSARNLARFGATVTAVDIADGLLEAAEALSAHVDPPVTYRHADAEALPFEDAAFDGVISTFGIMFAADHEAAAGELGRVCRPGGRISLAVWVPGPDSFVARVFATVAKHDLAPPPAASSMQWGRAEYVRELLGDDFELDFSERVSSMIAPGGDAVWRRFRDGFGPIGLLADRLDAEGLSAFENDFVALHEEFRVGARVQIDRDYLLVTGVRR